MWRLRGTGRRCWVSVAAGGYMDSVDTLFWQSRAAPTLSGLWPLTSGPLLAVPSVNND